MLTNPNPMYMIQVAAAKSPSRNSEPSSEHEEATASVDTATLDVATVLFSPNGNYLQARKAFPHTQHALLHDCLLQDIIIDEAVAGVDAINRAVVVSLLRVLGPLAFPVSDHMTSDIMFSRGVGCHGQRSNNYEGVSAVEHSSWRRCATEQGHHSYPRGATDEC
eukprot:2940819-Amphidinium_carterae.3